MAELCTALAAAEAGASAAAKTDAQWRAASDGTIVAEARCGELQDIVARLHGEVAAALADGGEEEAALQEAQGQLRAAEAAAAVKGAQVEALLRQGGNAGRLLSHRPARALVGRWDVWQLLPPRHVPPPPLPSAPRHSQPAP